MKKYANGKISKPPTCHPTRDLWARGLCNSCYKKQWRLENPDKELETRKKAPYETPEAKRARHLFNKYRITLDDYLELFNEQNGVCAICGQTNNGVALCVDHCHKTGEVRGLLCTLCNKGLGHFDDDVELLNKAIQYLFVKNL